MLVTHQNEDGCSFCESLCHNRGKEAKRERTCRGTNHQQGSLNALATATASRAFCRKLGAGEDDDKDRAHDFREEDESSWNEGQSPRGEGPQVTCTAVGGHRILMIRPCIGRRKGRRGRKRLELQGRTTGNTSGLLRAATIG